MPRLKKYLGKALIVMVLLLVVVMTVYPLLWMLSGSLKDNQEFYSNLWGPPAVFRWSNYVNAWRRAGIAGKAVNSVIVFVFSLLVIIPCVSFAAYAIARVEFKGKKTIYTYLLLGLCMPTGVLAIPIFATALQYDMVNTLRGMIFFGSAQCMAFGTYLLRSFFITLPKGLEEAAMVDGCSRLQSFIYVILPLAKPGMMTLVVLDGVTIWNEYLLANILISTDKYMTLPFGLKSFADKYVTDYPQLFAALVIVTIPILIIYAFAQRSFIEGMTAGSVKQ